MTQEREEDLQRQEEAWREDKRIRKSHEEAEEQNKQAEMYACMKKEQQVPEDEEPANPQGNTRSNKNMSVWHSNIPKICLIPQPLCH